METQSRWCQEFSLAWAGGMYEATKWEVRLGRRPQTDSVRSRFFGGAIVETWSHGCGRYNSREFHT